jgi:hypothetical protein
VTDPNHRRRVKDNVPAVMTLVNADGAGYFTVKGINNFRVTSRRCTRIVDVPNHVILTNWVAISSPTHENADVIGNPKGKRAIGFA